MMGKNRIKALRLMAVSMIAALALNNTGITVFASGNGFYDETEEVIVNTDVYGDIDTEETIEVPSNDEEDESIKNPSEFIDNNSEQYGYFRYELDQNGNAIITEYTGFESTVNIPSQIDGHDVVSIGESAFICCSSLKSVTMPDTVTSLGFHAFEGCSSLTRVSMPDCVTSIGY